MRKLLEFAGSRTERNSVRTWSACGCVAPLIQEMRLAGVVIQWTCSMCVLCDRVGTVC